MSSIPRNKPPKGSMSQFFLFCFFLIDLYLSKYEYTLCTYLQVYLLIIGLVSGSAEQPQPALNGRALSQPRPHLSDRIV